MLFWICATRTRRGTRIENISFVSVVVVLPFPTMMVAPRARRPRSSSQPSSSFGSDVFATWHPSAWPLHWTEQPLLFVVVLL